MQGIAAVYAYIEPPQKSTSLAPDQETLDALRQVPKLSQLVVAVVKVPWIDAKLKEFDQAVTGSLIQHGLMPHTVEYALQIDPNDRVENRLVIFRHRHDFALDAALLKKQWIAP